MRCTDTTSRRPGPTPLRTQLSRVAAGVFALGLFVSANVLAAPIHRAAKPITDDQGRTRVIIDFLDTAQDAYPAELIARFNPKTDRVHPQVEALIQTYERQYGFTRAAITSWVGASVTSYLTATQVEQLSSDKNVRLLTEDHAATFSTSPPWYANWNGGAPWTELNDWGRVAVNGKTLRTDSTRKVYLIDSGVAYHDDLGSVSERVNLRCSTLPAGSCTPLDPRFPVVGCYAHATHVAGIVGATANNGQNRAGVYSGVNVVSINFFDSGTGSCAYANTPRASDVGVALDYIRYQNTSWMGFSTPVQIVNLSLNNAQLGFSVAGVAESNWPKVNALVTPQMTSWYVYNGSVFVNSAGNFNRDACDLSTYVDSDGETQNGSPAYKTSANATSTAIDGVLVVGAVDSSGYQAVSFPATEPAGLTGSPSGSNYGPCVDLWAPGSFIYSTWGYGPSSTTGPAPYSGGQPSSYQLGSPWSTSSAGWAWLSGTSMAAPHVAAAAAYIADKYQLTTPAEIESAVRQWARWFGAYDSLGNQVRIVYLPND